MAQHKVFLFALAVLFLCIAIPRLYYPDLDHSDEYADADSLNAGRNFQRHGFISTRFLPVLQPQVPALQKAYTHYPPLTQIVFALPRVLFGLDALAFPRAMALVFSFLNLLFWYLCVRRFSGSGELAFLSGLFFLSNPYFIYGIDGISQLSLADALRSMILFLFIRLRDEPGAGRRRTLAVLWVLCTALSLATYEYIIWLSLFFALFGVFFREQGRPSKRDLCVLLSAPVAGFILHLLQNAWYFGSLAGALRDLGRSALERIAQSSDIPVAGLTLKSWFREVIVHNISLAFVFNIFLLLVIVFIAYLLHQQNKPDTRQHHARLARFFALLLVCGVSWYVCFPAHSLAHVYVYFLVRHLLPAASFGYAFIFWVLFDKARGSGGSMRLARQGAVILGIVFVVYSGFVRSGLPVNSRAILYADDFLSFKRCLLQLKSASAPDEIIGLNYHRWPFIAYYTDRACVKIHDSASLKDAEPALPDYFIFIPYNHPAAAALLDQLLTEYTTMYQCPSMRFPAVFLKRKT